MQGRGDETFRADGTRAEMSVRTELRRGWKDLRFDRMLHNNGALH